ncbi:hypothetical protein [Mycolicibacterium goodii]|jgi:hypothetical protein|uniref:hypothetical protein n=1 Tax=Mycolicibacterium goodii TaxID=134601 RepID=UPI0012FFD2C2
MQLDDFRREVNWQLACGNLADLELPVTSDDGGCPVVVALEHEPLSVLLGRLRAVGGYANLFVWFESGVRAASVIDTSCAIPEGGDDLTSPGERPGATATVGMFMDYVAQRPHGVVLSAISGDVTRPAMARDTRPVEFAQSAS